MITTVRVIGERIKVVAGSSDDTMIASFECSQKEAERLHHNLEVAFRELGELRLKRQAEAEKYMEEG